MDPLRNELKRLESDANKKTKEGEEVKERIIALEQSIGSYKEEYAQLIGQAEHIKSDLASVEEKVRETEGERESKSDVFRLTARRPSSALFERREIDGRTGETDSPSRWRLSLEMLFSLLHSSRTRDTSISRLGNI